MIKVEDLQFQYRSNKDKTLKGIDFSIQRGEVFGFLGPSGAGKSTTQKILMGLLKGYKGYVQIGGKEVNSFSNEDRSKIGVAFEFPNFYNELSALENLEFFGNLYGCQKKDPVKLLGRVGLGSDARKKVEDYSKGMKMRLNFCRALMHDPDILFFDEPTSGLDPVNSQVIKEWILEEKSRGKTIFLTTHNMQAAEDLCDRVSFIVDGELALTDSPSELKIRYGKREVTLEQKGIDGITKNTFSLDGIGSNLEFLQCLKEDNIRSIHSHDASLDDIFIQTTGRKLI